MTTEHQTQGEKMSDSLPNAVSESVLTIGAATLRVTQMDNGQRMIDADDVDKFFMAGGLPEELNDAWQTDTERELARVTADRDALLAACKAVAEWFGASSPEDEAVLKQVHAAIDQAERH